MSVLQPHVFPLSPVLLESGYLSIQSEEEGSVFRKQHFLPTLKVMTQVCVCVLRRVFAFVAQAGVQWRNLGSL